jgi:AcrR family transcriptional regulator
MKSYKTSSNGRGAQSSAALYKGRPARTKAPARPAQRAGRPTSAELERRKAKVMEVATALFAQHGYAATSLVDIAKAAGVATRTLYQHFGDKESIFYEVVTARESGAVFPHPNLADDLTLFDGVMHVARYICDVSLRPRSVDLMRLVIAESQRFPGFMKELCLKTFSHFRANVALMFDELAARNLAPELDSAKSAQLLVDLILGSTPLLVYAGWTATRPTDAELEEKVELFILGRYGPNVSRRAREAKPRKAASAAAKKSASAAAPKETVAEAPTKSRRKS